MPYYFVCDHCKKRFDLETPEAKECPFCFWTSSVKREDELASEKKSASHASLQKNSEKKGKLGSGNLKYLFRALLSLILLAVVGFLAFKAYQKGMASFSRGQKVFFSIKPQTDTKQPPGVPKTMGIADLSPQDKEALYREVTIPADRVPDAGEQQVLGRVVPFQTGWSEKLASPAWTLEQYQKMIADQEVFYKMPFARSYKKKLEELFKTKYLAAADVFTKGDVLAARNLWMESLAFPLYSTDLKKHRAVALTMLRPFINDTLSKVSAMNQSLQDRTKRVKEEALSVEYQKLSALISKKKWQEAIGVIDAMVPEVDALRAKAKILEVPAPYPPSFGTIDADLQRPLMDLMTPGPSSTADLQPLQQDLVEKKEVLETFTDTYIKNAIAAYQSALGSLRDGKWEEAVQTLGSIQGPPVLQQDAARKIEILGKMIPQTPDSH